MTRKPDPYGRDAARPYQIPFALARRGHVRFGSEAYALSARHVRASSRHDAAQKFPTSEERTCERG